MEWLECVSSFIRVLNQCNTAGDVKTYSGSRRSVVFDIIDCLCRSKRHFQIRRAYHVHFLRVQPLYLPADYTVRSTGVDAQTRQLLTVKCWAIVVVKKNRGKDDMEMCYYPAFIIENSFRKTFERKMCQILSYLAFMCVMAIGL